MKLPWRLTIAAKIVLSRTGIPYSVWKKAGAFVLGQMERPEYSIGVFTKHFRGVEGRLKPGFVSLELGPGDSVTSAIIAKSHGGGHSYLVDVGAFATRDIQVYRNAAACLQRGGLAPPDLSDVTDFDALLSRCDAEYLTDGLAGLRRVPEGSVDYVWSHTVLQHVRLRDFDATVSELRRIMKPGGIQSHCVALSDHIGGGLNNLRFSEELWESEWMARSGFYTNRIRCSGLLDRFRKAGFTVDVLRTGRWQTLPLKRSQLAAPFRSLDESDLCISNIDFLAVYPTGS